MYVKSFPRLDARRNDSIHRLDLLVFSRAKAHLYYMRRNTGRRLTRIGSHDVYISKSAS